MKLFITFIIGYFTGILAIGFSKSGYEGRVKRNIDKIKSMSMDEMAEFINKDLWLFCKKRKCKSSCLTCIKEFLNEYC